MYLRDSHLNIIARIETLYNGDQQIYNMHGNLLGSFRVVGNITVDVHGNVVGYGNLLATLL